MRQYLGSVVPSSDNFFAALNSAVFSDGSFCYVPKGVRCPMELSTYFRINAKDTGQFERTLIIADEGAYVSYLEGCTAPMRDTNQLHAAVVELVALDRAQIKYSTVQNWYPGDKEGKGGIYNFVTKRGACRGVNSKISWTQVETGSAITWKYPSCLLIGDHSVGEFYSVALTNNYQQADTGTKMIHIGKNTTSTIVSKGISAGHGQNTYRGGVKILKNATRRAQLFAVRFAAAGRPMRRAHVPVPGSEEHVVASGARGLDVEDRRGPDFLLPAARDFERRRGLDDRTRVLQGSVPRTADGIRRGGAEAARREFGRKRWVKVGRTIGFCRLSMRRVLASDDRTRKAMVCPDPEERMALLEIKDLHAKVGEREILKGIDLTVEAGEVHAIMGPNGSGKSTLAQVLAGRELYVVTGGQVTYDGKDLLALTPEDRAREGIFLAFQYPVEIPGVSNMYFLKAALNTIRKHRDLPELDAMDFLNRIRDKMTAMNMDQTLLNRPVNAGFSGGEKKRNEIFQMAVLEPRLAILDETDSGLDIDALKLVAAGVNAMRSAERAMVVVTHYQRLLSEIVPDYVHVLADGRIVKSGGKELALELEEGGYAALGIQDEAEAVGKR